MCLCVSVYLCVLVGVFVFFCVCVCVCACMCCPRQGHGLTGVEWLLTSWFVAVPGGQAEGGVGTNVVRGETGF